MAEAISPIAEGAVPWRPNTYIANGTKVVQENRVYIANTPHTSSTKFGHDLERGLWDFAGSATIVDTTGLATEEKQGTDTQNPPSGGTGIIGWLESIWNRLSGGSLMSFFRNGIEVNVARDDADPANNQPLPTALFNSVGEINGTNPLQQAQFDPETGARQIVDLNGAAKSGEAIILCGDVLYGQALSPLLWVDLGINGGSTFGAPGEQRLETGGAADGEACLQTLKFSRFMISQFNIAHFGMQMDPAGNLLDPNTITEWGCVDFIDTAGAKNLTPNGFFFRVKGDPTEPVWSIVNVKDGVENEVFFDDWNGPSKDLFAKAPTLSVYEMQYNAGTVNFFQGPRFIHRLAGLSSTYAATYHLPVSMRIRNINGNTNNRSFGSRAAGAYRLGEERGELISRTFTANTLIKTGAGYVGKASLSRTGSSGGSGTALVYDGIDATGILIGRLDVGGDDIKGIAIDGTFSAGLYIEISGSGTNTVTINFE